MFSYETKDMNVSFNQRCICSNTHTICLMETVGYDILGVAFIREIIDDTFSGKHCR